MNWKVYHEAIDLQQRRFRYFPHVFRWRGHRYEVEAVERSWTVSRLGWRCRVERRFFRVQCGEAIFDLYQDLRANTWHLWRARPAVAALPLARRIASACR